MAATAADLRQALTERVVVADGAMGTMLQAADLSLDDFEGHEGCNEILNVTRPDVVAGVHEEYLAVGVDAVETNTFGANLGNLAEYGIEDRIFELAEAGARIAREVADGLLDPDRPRWVLGSVGPGDQAAPPSATCASRRFATRTRRRSKACSPAVSTPSS
jgi:5-methyltetrahydrofolate--homocysteine methyltransferase